MTEIYFNDTARVGTTVALESVTATVIDLYVYWKLGFRIQLVALLSSILSVGRDAWQQQQIGKLELLDLTLVVLEINDSMKAQEQLLGFNVLTLDAAAKSTAWLETLANRFNAGINTVIGLVDLTVGVLDRVSETGCFDVDIDKAAVGSLDAEVIGSNESIVLVLEEVSNTSIKDSIVCLDLTAFNKAMTRYRSTGAIKVVDALAVGFNKLMERQWQR